MAFAVLVVTCVGLVAWFLNTQFDTEHPLPNGYLLVTDTQVHGIYSQSAPRHASHQEGGIVVWGHVDEFTIVGDRVFGHISSRASADPELKTQPGWFVFDTDSNEIKYGLSRYEFEDELSQLGIKPRELEFEKP